MSDLRVRVELREEGGGHVAVDEGLHWWREDVSK